MHQRNGIPFIRWSVAIEMDHALGDYCTFLCAAPMVGPIFSTLQITETWTPCLGNFDNSGHGAVPKDQRDSICRLHDDLLI